MKIIIFDKSSLAWVKDMESNYHYLLHQCKYFTEICAIRGYIYLNQICESLCIKWDPDKENICYRRKICTPLMFDFERLGEDSFVVIIR